MTRSVLGLGRHLDTYIIWVNDRMEVRHDGQ
jgi:hypothetical protein